VNFVVKGFMKRPVIITIVSVLCCTAAVYLCAIAATLLIRPGTFSLMSANQLMYGMELAGPFMMLLFGLGYAAVGWGLLRLHNWSRIVVILLMIISVGSLVPKISMAELGLPIFGYGLQIAVRVALGWYLAASPAALDAFARKSRPRIAPDSHE
jgi:hypothetical protein